jgi:hypothetical protein
MWHGISWQKRRSGETVPALQRQLFETALGLISERDLVNTVIEVGYSDEQIRIPAALTCTINERTNAEWRDMSDLTYTASQ